MSDIFKCVERLLNDNGVRVDIEELQPNYPDDDMRCIRIEKKILTLDFSEHDKVFKDKIANLEENVGYYKDSLSRVEKNCDKLYHENQELKQRIAELKSKNNRLTESILRKATKIHDLESKESAKPMKNEFYADNGEMLTPLEVANSLINQNIFKVDELRELSEFLQVYCNHHEDRDIEPNIMLF